MYEPIVQVRVLQAGSLLTASIGYFYHSRYPTEVKIEAYYVDGWLKDSTHLLAIYYSSQWKQNLQDLYSKIFIKHED